MITILHLLVREVINLSIMFYLVKKNPTFIKQISLPIYSRVYAYSYTFEKIILLRVVLYL